MAGTVWRPFLTGSSMNAYCYRVAVLAGLLLGGPVWGQHQTDNFSLPYLDGILPYSVEIREVSLEPAAVPNIHSIAAAEWQGQWVFLAGRTNGLHGLTGMNAFDPAYENREVWVIDPVTRESWQKNLETSAASGLSQDLVDSLSAVNTEFYQDDSRWIIVGGYGYKRSLGNHLTYPALTAIDLPGLVNWVKEPAGEESSQAADHITQIEDSYFQVTGGGLERIGEEYQLIFGQNYTGSYRPMLNGVYTQQVRRFTIDFSDGITIPEASKLPTLQNDAFRRRDLNVLTILERSGIGSFEERALVLSGVFTPETGVWTVPVHIGPGGSVLMDAPGGTDTLKQGFQVYHCSKVSLYNRITSEAHILLFGGLTVLERNLNTGTFEQDDQVPFTNQCSLVVRESNGRIRQYWLPTRFPEILLNDKELHFGTNAEFFFSRDVPRLHPKVIDLARITDPMVIGHILGGIVSDAGNGGNTGASGRIFEVTLVPQTVHADLSISRSPELELQWVELEDRSDLLETSTDLNSWQELTPSLTDTDHWTITTPDSRRFYRRLSAPQTRPE